MSSELTDRDYRKLLEFRDGLRRFSKWSSDRAREAGLTARQHQLLLVVRGHDEPAGPTISDVAGHLLLRHHSTVELIDRCVQAGLVHRVSDEEDARVVRIRITSDGGARLRALTELHLAELTRLAPRMAPIWEDLVS